MAATDSPDWQPLQRRLFRTVVDSQSLNLAAGAHHTATYNTGDDVLVIRGLLSAGCFARVSIPVSAYGSPATWEFAGNPQTGTTFWMPVQSRGGEVTLDLWNPTAITNVVSWKVYGYIGYGADELRDSWESGDIGVAVGPGSTAYMLDVPSAPTFDRLALTLLSGSQPCELRVKHVVSTGGLYSPSTAWDQVALTLAGGGNTQTEVHTLGGSTSLWVKNTGGSNGNFHVGYRAYVV